MDYWIENSILASLIGRKRRVKGNLSGKNSIVKPTNLISPKVVGRKIKIHPITTKFILFILILRVK